MMSRSILLLLTALLPLAPLALADDLPQGKVLERVACQADPGQDYALFLPETYDPSRAWPILYCFDPGGEGKRPVELFREAAAELGVIVVGSNQSRNGVPFAPACRALWRDTHDRFRLNDRAVMAAGFSGGMHVACGLAAAAAKEVAGIIGCGNGLPPWMGIEELARTPFFFLFSGLDDFNSQRNRELARGLAAKGCWTFAEVFLGGHEWPPAPLLAESLRALLLRLGQAGRVEMSQALVSHWQNEQKSALERAAKAGEKTAAYLELRRSLAALEGIGENRSARTALETLAADSEVREFRDLQEGIDRREDEIRSKLIPGYLSLFAGELDALQVSRGIHALGIERLVHDREGAKSTVERSASRRVLEDLTLTAFVDGSRLLEQKQWSQAETACEIWRRCSPAKPWPLLYLASAAAAQGEKRRALKLVRSALEMGLDDPAALEIPLLAPLRGEEEFQEIQKELKSKK